MIIFYFKFCFKLSLYIITLFILRYIVRINQNFIRQILRHDLYITQYNLLFSIYLLI